MVHYTMHGSIKKWNVHKEEGQIVSFYHGSRQTLGFTREDLNNFHGNFTPEVDMLVAYKYRGREGQTRQRVNGFATKIVPLKLIMPTSRGAEGVAYTPLENYEVKQNGLWLSARDVKFQEMGKVTYSLVGHDVTFFCDRAAIREAKSTNSESRGAVPLIPELLSSPRGLETPAQDIRPTQTEEEFRTVRTLAEKAMKTGERANNKANHQIKLLKHQRKRLASLKKASTRFKEKVKDHDEQFENVKADLRHQTTETSKLADTISEMQIESKESCKNIDNLSKHTESLEAVLNLITKDMAEEAELREQDRQRYERRQAERDQDRQLYERRQAERERKRVEYLKLLSGRIAEVDANVCEVKDQVGANEAKNVKKHSETVKKLRDQKATTDHLIIRTKVLESDMKATKEEVKATKAEVKATKQKVAHHETRIYGQDRMIAQLKRRYDYQREEANHQYKRRKLEQRRFEHGKQVYSGVTNWLGYNGNY